MNEAQVPVNLLQAIPHPLPIELIQPLLESPHVRIERIVSRQHASPPGFWYDQDTDEYVVLLAGSAGLQIEGRDEPITLKPGDAIFLPAHQRHRVDWTDPNQDTIWLAIHIDPVE